MKSDYGTGFGRSGLMLALFLAVLLPLAAFAGVNTWTTNGPAGARIATLAIDPVVTTTLYAGSSSAGVFKSTDGGSTWIVTNTGFSFVYALAIDPSNTTTLYAGTSGGGIYKSTDGGSTWSKNTGLSYPYPTVQALAIDPSNTTTLYAGTGGGVFKSTDGGGSWSTVNSGLTNTIVQALAIDPSNTSTLYAGTGGGVFKSTDGGGSWSAMNSGLTNTVVQALAIDPSNTTTLYAGTDGGVFKSTDGGISWSAVNTGLTNTVVQALAIAPLNATTLYVGIYKGGVYTSTDGGSVWGVMNSGLTNTNVHALAIDPSNTITLYAGTDNGVFSYSGGCTLLCMASASPDSGTAPLDVSFNATVTPSNCTGTPTFDWSFGDGSAHSSEQNPTHTYGTEGTYDWTMTASVNGQTCTKMGTITVSVPCTLTCTASASPDSGTAPLDVSFNATVTPSNCTGTPSFDWSFGDGSAHSSEQNPTHTYGAAGTYTWTLTVAAGGQTCTKTGAITVYTSLAVSLAATPTSGMVPLAVAFSPHATGGNGNYTYDFIYGDGSSAGSSPAHTYTTAGTYSATVTVTDAASHTAMSNVINITVCVLSAQAMVQAVGNTGADIAFKGSVAPTPCGGTPSFQWAFGDETTSILQNPTHTYTTAGSYSWTLTVTEDNATSSQSGSINIVDPPVIGKMAKMRRPFRIKVTGGNLQEGIKVYINGQLWGDTTDKKLVKWKSSEKILIKKGATLKVNVPKNTSTTFRFVNPDGGETTLYWQWP